MTARGKKEEESIVMTRFLAWAVGMGSFVIEQGEK